MVEIMCHSRKIVVCGKSVVISIHNLVDSEGSKLRALSCDEIVYIFFQKANCVFRNLSINLDLILRRVSRLLLSNFY